MTLTDLINEVKQSRNKVIPTSYILSRLKSIESHDCTNCTHLEVYAMESFPRASQNVKEVI